MNLSIILFVYNRSWHTKQNTKLNLELLQERMYESAGLNRGTVLDEAMFKAMMHSKIEFVKV